MTCRGNETFLKDGKYYYVDTNELVSETYKTRPCGNCGRAYTSDGHDGWCGKLNDEENLYSDIIIGYFNNSIDITENESLEADLISDDFIEITNEEYLNYIKNNSLTGVLDREKYLKELYIKNIKDIINLKEAIKNYNFK